MIISLGGLGLGRCSGGGGEGEGECPQEAGGGGISSRMLRPEKKRKTSGLDRTEFYPSGGELIQRSMKAVL
jgi:hypothetical protein